LEDLSRAGGKGIGQRAWGEEQRASLKGFGDQVSAIKKFQITKYKYQMVRQAHHLTTLSQVEGQITMTEIQNSKQLVSDLI
jgi:hypothetical protein